MVKYEWNKNQRRIYNILEAKTKNKLTLNLVRNILRSLLIAEELDSWVGDNTSTIRTISFKQSTETLTSPDIFQALYCSIVFYVMWILDLQTW